MSLAPDNPSHQRAAKPMPLTTHLQPPLPRDPYDPNWPFQNGITDPTWPDDYPGNVRLEDVQSLLESMIEADRMRDDFSPGEVAALLEDQGVTRQEDLQSRYDSDYAGRVDRQGFQSIMRATVRARHREELKNVLRMLTLFAVDEMQKKPSRKHIRVLEQIPDSYRVTITLGFGLTLFVDETGFDRYGLRHKKPNFLKMMPSFPGDHRDFDPTKSGSDLILVVSSDHPYVNVAIVRFFAEYFNKRFGERYLNGDHYEVLRFDPVVEEGFARKDKREFLKFDDGIDNVHSVDELKRLIYVDESDNEPEWCANGSYLVYRKIQENMPVWEAFLDKEQSAMIGREKATGMPLSRQREGTDLLVPVYPDPRDPLDGQLNAHVRKVQPRRPTKDLFGLDDKERRFLRRPYPFFDGLGPRGNSINGLHFIAFMKSIQQQFEHVVNMWQMNPHFPVKDTGLDALYAKGVLSTIDGGYYFCPPGLKGENDYFGSGMFED